MKSLQESQDEELIGIQAAVALHKDEKGQSHFKDVGLTPVKGAVGGVVLGAVAVTLTGGTGITLGKMWRNWLLAILFVGGYNFFTG